MNTYHFRANNKVFVVDADKPREAMVKANAHFGTLPQGAWMDSAEKGHYYWALGNFFD